MEQPDNLEEQLTAQLSAVTDVTSIQDGRLRDQLASYINELILRNFDRLISLLYRMDIPEQKLKALLKANEKEDAGHIIASLMIERQLQKIKTRQESAGNDVAYDDEERW
ncbi:MAG TPA: hypothetical protein PLC48_00620 [Ferruginibacter sp.]|nr:hypothetical protein [Ferruginibacter sp.]